MPDPCADMIDPLEQSFERERRGANDPSYRLTEAWRHECEVRHVRNLTALRRRAYLEGVARRRGRMAAALLASASNEIG